MILQILYKAQSILMTSFQKIGKLTILQQNTDQGRLITIFLDHFNFFSKIGKLTYEQTTASILQ